MTRWNCKLCKTWGRGGPDGWERHYKAQHQDDVRVGALVSFGFAPNYSWGSRSPGTYIRPVRLDGER